MRVYFAWPAEAVESLKHLWASGLPASGIAKQIGTTKNSVIGMAHRLKLEQRRERNPELTPEEAHRRKVERDRRRNARRRNSTVPRPRVKREPAHPRTPRKWVQFPKPRQMEVEVMPTNPPIRLVDAPMHGVCKHIAGEPNGPDTLYCGAVSVPGQSWCAYHRLLLYRPREDRRQVYAFKESA